MHEQKNMNEHIYNMSSVVPLDLNGWQLGNSPSPAVVIHDILGQLEMRVTQQPL